MQDNNKMDTLTERMEDLKNRGFKEEFKVEGNNMKSQDGTKSYKSDELKVVEHYRFEGQSDPGDMTIIYGIITNDNTKGILVDGFGTYSDQEQAEFMHKVYELHKGTIY